MIETKHLEFFLKERVGRAFQYNDMYEEAISEIIKRLRAYDKLKADIKSNEVDRRNK